MAPATAQVYAMQAREVTRRNRAVIKELKSDGIPKEVGELILQSRYLNTALMVWAESKRQGVELSEMAIRILAVGRATGIQGIIDDLSERPAGGRWDPIALRILFYRFCILLREAVKATDDSIKANTVDSLEGKLRKGPLRDVREQVDALLEGDSKASVATLLVAEERIRGALTRIQS